jgi:TonB family protein
MNTARILVVIAAILLSAAPVLRPHPASAETLDDCASLFNAGKWHAAAEACNAVIQEALEGMQSDEPSIREHVKVQLVWCYASYYEGSSGLHLNEYPAKLRLPMARYNLARAVTCSNFIAHVPLQGGEMSLQRRRAQELHTIANDALAAFDKKFPQYVPVRTAARASGNNLLQQGLGIPKSTADPYDTDPSCNREAYATSALSPVSPDSARDLVSPVAVLITVSLDASGNLIDATVQQSSGNADIDAAALSAAKQSRYAPKLVNCKAVPASAIFQAVFNPF